MTRKESENLRVRLGEDLKADFDSFLSAKRITQQAAITSMIEWVLDQPPLLQSMVLGQIPRNDLEVLHVLARRLEENHSGR